jgi:hypothetical protein
MSAAARDEPLAANRPPRDDVGIEHEYEARRCERRRIQLDDLLALPWPYLPRAAEAPEGGKVLVLHNHAQRQLGPVPEMPADVVRLVGADHYDQLVEQPGSEMHQGAEEQIEAREVVAIVAPAHLQGQQSAQRSGLCASTGHDRPRQRRDPCCLRCRSRLADDALVIVSRS